MSFLQEATENGNKILKNTLEDLKERYNSDKTSLDEAELLFMHQLENHLGL